MPIWPIGLRELPGWIAARLRAAGLQPDRDAVALIADRVEGNLLAADQEIQKLSLLLGEGRVTAAEVNDAVANSSRYDVYKLTDAALAGDGRRSVKILGGLRAEGVEPVIVMWALTRELRTLATLDDAIRQGAVISAVGDAEDGRLAQSPGIWFGAVSVDINTATFIVLLKATGDADAAAKGQRCGDPWQLATDIVVSLVAMKPIGVFGGTFDPIHYGHLRTAFEMLQALRFEEVRFMPCGDPPHRGVTFADAGMRYQQMVEVGHCRAGRVLSRTIVSCRSDGPSYTIDTLTELREEHPERSLGLIVGMDAFLGLSTWHRWNANCSTLRTLLLRIRPGWKAPDIGPLGELITEHGTHRVADVHNATAWPHSHPRGDAAGDFIDGDSGSHCVAGTRSAIPDAGRITKSGLQEKEIYMRNGTHE